MAQFPALIQFIRQKKCRSAITYLLAMVGAALLLLLPVLVSSVGDGNIRLLEDEVATALKACVLPGEEARGGNRHRRSEDYPRIDNTKQTNQYSHERRNASDMREQNILVLNATDYDYGGYGSGNGGEKLVTSAPRLAGAVISNASADINGDYSSNRTRRSEPLINKPDADQCLSQCVFANLQVVDTRGIPRESELWNKVQASVTSQQSRNAMRDQIRACFQELQSEAEDNGCSYSNKLERCLMLRFADRKTDKSTSN
ncbi:uncharacterized protein LOC128677493 [Plodia interpunctella]|uniref:uncharacterized protein LOC128677493 n=1 Tax=Plodia interpunctella TaxID=58824 RepID=UPI0023688FBD|nr:uncharacterized protein LOC128677493 [Plodia interpunctella]